MIQGWASVSLHFRDPRAPEVLSALAEGLAAEIHFQLRLYRRAEGHNGFRGDRLLAERRLTQTARYDLFEQRYVIERQGGRTSEYSDPEAFLEAFCSLRDVPVGALPDGEAAGHYLLARAWLYPVRISFPLSLIILFRPQLAVSSPWLEEEL